MGEGLETRGVYEIVRDILNTRLAPNARVASGIVLALDAEWMRRRQRVMHDHELRAVAEWLRTIAVELERGATVRNP